MFWIVQLCLLIAVDSLLNETDLEVVVYSGQLDLIVDTLGRSTHLSHPAVTWLFFYDARKASKCPATFSLY